MIVYRWLEHTGEAELEVRAPSREQVFAEALRAVAELLAAEGTPASPGQERVEVELSADDDATLLAAWLEELVYLAEAQGFVASGVAELELGDARLRAELTGRRAGASPLVKAVTYHRLALEPCAEGWRATVVLDV